jgi:hypothetical protein
MYECVHCGKDNFKTQRGLTQHQQRSAHCNRDDDGFNYEISGYYTADEGMQYRNVLPKAASKRSDERSLPNNKRKSSSKENSLLIQKFLPKSVAENAQQCQPCGNPGTDMLGTTDEEYSTAMEYYSDEFGDRMEIDDEDSVLYENSDDESNTGVVPEEERMLQFREYCAKAKKFMPFSKEECDAINCMVALRKTKASLGTYSAVMEWHLKATGALAKWGRLGECEDYISREKLIRDLKERYNIEERFYGIEHTIELPSSHSCVKIITNDAATSIRSLLTDPRVTDEDYLFFYNNPFSRPPQNLDYLGDLNTGLSYRETYRQRIQDPAKEILCPIQLYADGCATGQFANLSITQVKICLGIHNASARKKDYLWRDIGFIPNVSTGTSRGRRIFLDSGHCDAVMAHQDILNTEGLEENNAKIDKLEDYHAMIAHCLESYKAIQDGIYLDFFYRGKLYEGVKFVFYIANVKVDNEEASKFCGHYGSNVGIASLCRQCTVPTVLSSKSLANYPPKLEADIRRLVEEDDVDALKAISQHNFENAFWGLHFGAHDGSGIHGACMFDILHTLYLGIFVRVRDAFFEQVGPSSNTSTELDALAREYGTLLQRQSERDLPKTSFKKTIMGGKLMAKEFEGVLLLLALLLRCSKGRELLQEAASKNFEDDNQIKDWTLLVETLLGWIQWLKSDTMHLEHVKKTKWKHRYIMHLIKKIMNRTEGMGLRIIKFHMICHLTSNMLVGGVPMLMDTGSDESGHKETKTASMLTQKRQATFDAQTNQRLLETRLLQMAVSEMEGRPLYEYLIGYSQKSHRATAETTGNTTSGARITCKIGDTLDEDSLEISTKLAHNDQMFAEGCYVKFVARLTRRLEGILPGKLTVLTEHKRKGTIFRAHMKYRGGVWRDWVNVNWGDDGILPNKLWGFVDLRALPANNNVHFGGLENIKPGVYGIVESAAYVDNAFADQRSEIFIPIRKEVKRMVNGTVNKLQFYLADTDAFVEPVCVVPDIGGGVTDYFAVKSRVQWKEDFEDWLETPDRQSIFYDHEDDSDDEEYENTDKDRPKIYTKDKNDDDLENFNDKFDEIDESELEELNDGE